MASRRELEQQAARDSVMAWLRKHPGKFYRIPDIAQGANISNSAANMALHTLTERGELHVEERRKRNNGKRYPVYRFSAFGVPDGPSWLCPQAPTFTPDQIKGLRTVLGFTGNMEIKQALSDGRKV